MGEKQPRIIADLVAGEDGAPRFSSSDAKKHYSIVFEVADAPANAYACTFELHDTYYDPARTVNKDSEGRFRLRTTTYGDFRIKARLRTKAGDIFVTDSVINALRHSDSDTQDKPKFSDAINTIANH